jgi:hypothetical protein
MVGEEEAGGWAWAEVALVAAVPTEVVPVME